MMVDPDILAMLEAGRMANPPPLEMIPLAEFRDGYRRKYFERSVTVPGEVVEEEVDIASSPSARLRIFRPAGLKRPAPAIVYLHGGGFVLGDAHAYARQSARIASLCGAVVFFVDYRLAPEHPFPAAVDDALAGADYVVDRSDFLGIDRERIALMGDSAGGNLAIATALHLRRRLAFRLLCLLYPVVDFRPYVAGGRKYPSDEAFGSGFGLDFVLMQFFARHYFGGVAKANDPRLSPIVAKHLGALPETCVFAAGNDVLRDQGQRFADCVAAEGGRVSYTRFDSLIHNFMGHAVVSPAANAAFETVCARVAAALR